MKKIPMQILRKCLKKKLKKKQKKLKLKIPNLKLLKVLMLTNTALFAVCTLITFAVFALVYAAGQLVNGEEVT